MGSQELAFDDEMSLDENQIIAPTSGFDESPSREIRKHLNALQFRQLTVIIIIRDYFYFLGSIRSIRRCSRRSTNKDS